MKRILGVDLGGARTGVAVSDELGMLAHPVETIQTGSTEAVAKRVQLLAREKDVECVVIGLPRHMNGSVGIAAQEAERFAQRLRTLVSCKVVTWDERLSTAEAERALRTGGKKARQTRGFRDQVAAQLILQSYLDRLNA